MKHLRSVSPAAVMITVGILFSSVSAQDSRQTAEGASKQKQQNPAIPRPKPGVPAEVVGQANSPFVPSPEMIRRYAVGLAVQNGAVYMVFPMPDPSAVSTGSIGVSTTNVLIPMPGGGASGCFSDNLSERIRLLERVIGGLPPR